MICLLSSVKFMLMMGWDGWMGGLIDRYVCTFFIFMASSEDGKMVSFLSCCIK